MLFGPFVFDDLDAVVGNRAVRERNWKRLWLWRPIANLSYAFQSRSINRTIATDHQPVSLKIVNVLIHSATALVLRQILLIDHSNQTATLAALLFAVHPFAVNAVSYISARAILLATFGGMLGLWAVLAGYPLLAVPAVAFAALAKEDGLLFALQLSLIALMSRGEWWPLLVLGPVGAFAVMSYLPQLWKAFSRTGSVAMEEGGLPGSLPQPAHALVTATEALIHLPLWLLGLGQSTLHSSGIGYSRVRMWIAIGIAATMFLTLPKFILILIFISPWIAYLILPTPEQLTETRGYAIGLAIPFLVTTFATDISMIVLIALSIIMTWRSAGHWSSLERIWKRSLSTGCGEKSRAWQELGAAYRDLGRLDDAILAFREALRLNDRLAPAYRNLARMCAVAGHLPESIDLLKRAVERCPAHAPAWEDLGLALESAGLSEADSAYRWATRLNPRLDFSQNRLGLFEFKRGNFAGARLRFEAALAVLSSNDEYLWNLALTLRSLGLSEEGFKLVGHFPPNINLTANMINPTLIGQPETTKS